MVKQINQLYTPFVNSPTEMLSIFVHDTSVYEKIRNGTLLGCVYTKKEIYDYLTEDAKNVFKIDSDKIGFRIEEMYMDGDIGEEEKLHINITPCRPLGHKIHEYGLDEFEVRPRVSVSILSPECTLEPHFKTMAFSYRNFKSSFLPITFDLIFKGEEYE